MQCHHSIEDQDTIKLCVAGVPIFNPLSNSEMQEVAQMGVSKTYLKGELIFQPEDSSENLLIIHKGKVKIYQVAESGKEQLLRILEPGDFMGELSLFTNEMVSSFAEAMVKTEICMIKRPDLQELLSNHPKISMKILEEFGRRLSNAEKTIERLSLQDMEKRTASYLVDLVMAHVDPENTLPPYQLTLPMSKKDLSSFIGTTQETLSRRLSTFQDRGWITQTGQRNINILNFVALQDTAK
jgi:CRP/FNR family transcriptional regulator, anaerobic regulatory protein